MDSEEIKRGIENLNNEISLIKLALGDLIDQTDKQPHSIFCEFIRYNITYSDSKKITEILMSNKNLEREKLLEKINKSLKDSTISKDMLENLIIAHKSSGFNI